MDDGHAAPEVKSVTRRRKKGEPEPVIVSDQHLSDAVGLVTLVTNAYASSRKSAWTNGGLDVDYVEVEVAKLRLDADETLIIANPLARGLAEYGVSLPWWAQFGGALLSVYGERMGRARGIDAAIERRRHELAKGGNGEASPSPAP